MTIPISTIFRINLDYLCSGKPLGDQYGGRKGKQSRRGRGRDREEFNGQAAVNMSPIRFQNPRTGRH
jgi:hypothetical protein